jgi:hypothetical protein
MRIRLGSLVVVGSLLLPLGRVWSDSEKSESAAQEQTESREKQQAEEQEALSHYNKTVAKNGEHSTQAKKAWRRVVREYKEHGDTPPVPPTPETTPSAAK